jgi:hypothetical protein
MQLTVLILAPASMLSFQNQSKETHNKYLSNPSTRKLKINKLEKFLFICHNMTIKATWN